jgi:hypothetical protein
MRDQIVVVVVVVRAVRRSKDGFAAPKFIISYM